MIDSPPTSQFYEPHDYDQRALLTSPQSQVRGLFEMVEEPESEEASSPSTSESGWLKRWTERLTALQKFLLAIAGTIVALGVVITAVVTTGNTVGGKVAAGATGTAHSAVGPDGDSGQLSLHVTSAPPTQSSAPPPSPTPSLNISVTCQMAGPVHEGQQTTAMYTITSNQIIKVGLGMGVYDSGGTDYSTGDGDMDGYQLVVGKQTVKRDVVVPTQLPSDRIELDAEIWPNREIGADGVEALAEATCGTFNAP